MELLLILIYVSICYVTFKVFRIPVNQWSLATAALGGIIGIALLLLTMNYNHPFTNNARIYFAVTPVLPTVRGRVIEVPVKENAPLKEGGSDLARHPENEALLGVLAFRPEASLIYVNADAVLETVLDRLGAAGPSDIQLVVCDLSASPYLDLAGSRMLHELHAELTARGIALRIVGAHGWLRDLLRANGVSEKVGGLDRLVTLDRLLGGDGR